MTKLSKAQHSKDIEAHGQDHSKTIGAKDGALTRRAQNLAASSALNTGSRLAAAALWAALVTTTVATPLVLGAATGGVSQAKAEDLIGTPGGVGCFGSSIDICGMGGAGNGGGGGGTTNLGLGGKGGNARNGGGGGGSGGDNNLSVVE